MWWPSGKLELEAYSQKSEYCWKATWSELADPRQFLRTEEIVQELETMAANEPKVAGLATLNSALAVDAPQPPDPGLSQRV